MTTISKSALVEYSADKMFALVDDIPCYAEFLPWCQNACELSRSELEVRASLEIAHSGLRKSFTTLNYLDRHSCIEMRLVEGPFRHLHGKWRFEPLNETACKVMLDLDFEFSNKLLSLSFGPVFNVIASSLVDAFVKRAKSLYG